MVLAPRQWLCHVRSKVLLVWDGQFTEYLLRSRCGPPNMYLTRCCLGFGPRGALVLPAINQLLVYKEHTRRRRHFRCRLFPHYSAIACSTLPTTTIATSHGSQHRRHICLPCRGLPETHSASLVFGTKFLVDYSASLIANTVGASFFFFNTETGSAVHE